MSDLPCSRGAPQRRARPPARLSTGCAVTGPAAWRDYSAARCPAALLPGSPLQCRRRLAEQDFRRILVDGRLSVDLLRAIIGAHRRRAVANRLEPALEVGKILELLALPLVGHDPRIAGHVRDRIMLPRDESAIGEALVEHTIEPIGLVNVAADRVGQFLRRVLAEMMVLPRHRPEAAHLPEQPLDRLGPAAQIGGEEFSFLFSQIQQDSAGFEDRDRRAAVGRRLIDDRGDAVVRRDLEEFRLELLAGADADREQLVRNSRFLQEHRDFVAVRRRPVVEIDHRRALVGDG